MTPAEKALLSGLLSSGGGGVLDLPITAKHFSTVQGEILFDAIVQVVTQGGDANPASVVSASEHRDNILRFGGPAWVFELTDDYVSAASVPHYAEQVMDEADRRKLDLLARHIRERAAEGASIDEIVDATQNGLEGLGASEAIKLESVSDGIYETLGSLHQKPTYIETPWDNLNRYIHGWQGGRLYVVGARPSVGKTVVGVQAALSLCNMGPVAYTSLEMNKAELQKRIISHIAKVDMGRIAKHALTNEDWQRVEAAEAEWSNIPMMLNPSMSATLADVARHAWEVKRKHGLAAVVVDYIGLLSGRPGQSEYEVVTEASRKLKLLALSLDVPVIALSQLNRGSENRENKEPRKSDLRSSGAIENDADAIMLLHRDIMDTPHEMKIIIDKNRQGVTGEAFFEFAGHYSELRDA